MRSQLLIAAVWSAVACLCQRLKLSPNLLATLNASITSFDNLTSFSLHQDQLESTTTTNGSHDGNDLIRFSQEGFNFIGRTRTEQTIVQSLAVYLKDAFALLSDLPRRAAIHSVPAAYFGNVKSVLQISSTSISWNAGDLVKMLLILQHYFQDHRSRSPLDMSVSSDYGQRASIRIGIVPVERFVDSFPGGTGIKSGDRFEIYFYKQEVVQIADIQFALGEFGDWITNKDLSATLPKGLSKKFSGGNSGLFLETAEAGADSADMTYGILVQTLALLVYLTDRYLGTQWHVFRCSFSDVDEKDMGALYFVPKTLAATYDNTSMIDNASIATS